MRRGLPSLAGVVLALAAPAAGLAQPSGQALFDDNCSACHQRTGAGVKGAFPALAGNKLVQGPPAAVAGAVLVGRGGMPAFRNEFTDDQLAAILTYMRSAWGNKARPISPAEVALVRNAGATAARPGGLQAH